MGLYSEEESIGFSKLGVKPCVFLVLQSLFPTVLNLIMLEFIRLLYVLFFKTVIQPTLHAVLRNARCHPSSYYNSTVSFASAPPTNLEDEADDNGYIDWGLDEEINEHDRQDVSLVEIPSKLSWMINFCTDHAVMKYLLRSSVHLMLVYER